MSEQLSLEFLGGAQSIPLDVDSATRGEPRTQIVRIVEYTPYPRRTRDERRRVAFTRDTSASGMCIAVENAEEPGTLLRVVGTDVDGDASSNHLARVAWCEPRSDSRFWVGLELISATGVGRMLKVRHTARRQKVPVYA